MQNPQDLFQGLDKKYYPLVFDSSSEGILVLDKQLLITFANKKTAELLGFSSSELLGMNLSDFLPDKKFSSLKNKLQDGTNTALISMQALLLGRGQLSVHCDMTAFPIGTEKDSFFLLLTITQKKADKLNPESDPVLAEERAQMAATAGNVGIWDWDVQNDHLVWDKRMFELYDVSLKKFTPSYSGWLNLLHPDDVEFSDKVAKQALAIGSPYVTEFRILLSNQHIRYIKALGKVICDPNGHPTHLIGVNLDITEQKWVEKANRLMIDAQWKIVHTNDIDKIYQLVGKTIQEIIEEGTVAVTALNEANQSVHIQWVYGVSDTYQKLIDKFKIDPTKIEFLIKDIDPDTLKKYRSGKFEKYSGGLYLLAQKRVPKAICQAAEKVMGMGEIYIMGFVWGERHYGGVIISPGKGKDIRPVASSIESIVNLATQAIKKIRSENALRVSEIRFRDFFENAPISLWEEDFSAVKQQVDALKSQGISDFAKYFSKHPTIVSELAKQIKILNVNKASLEMLHAKDKNDLIENFDKIVGEKGNNFQSELTNIAEGKTDFEWEGINHTLDGKPLTLDLHWSAAPNDKETLAKVFVSITDVTDRRQAETKVRESEERFRKVFEESPIGIFLSDSQFLFTSVNPMASAILGYSAEELLGQSFKAITYPDDILENEKLLTQLVKIKLPYFTMQKRYIHKNGSIIWTNLIVTAIRNESGELTAVLSMIEDITAKKQAEEALDYEHYLMQTLMDNIPDSVYFKDASSHFIRVNQATAKKFGLPSPDDVLGKSDADFFPEETANEWSLEEQNIIQTGIPLIGVESIEIWKDHRPSTWASDTKMPLRDRSGKVIGTFGITRDITNIKNKEEEIKQLNADLEKKVQARTKELSLRNQELEAFAYSISHDLKAPLRGINGYSQLILQEHSSQLDEEGKLFLNKLILSSEQLTQLIDDLFSYTRLERRPINRVDFSVKEIAEAIIDERRLDIQNRHTLLHLNIDDQLINSSPELFTQILKNYLDNAIKYTDKVETPEIWIEFKNFGATSLLTVRDNGIGFDMKYSEKLFDVFYRLHRLDEYPGTGIGLALVKKAADLLGYHVWAEGQINTGATFYLELKNS